MFPELHILRVGNSSNFTNLYMLLHMSEYLHHRHVQEQSCLEHRHREHSYPTDGDISLFAISGNIRACCVPHKAAVDEEELQAGQCLQLI
jgi:hypothetical protein